MDRGVWWATIHGSQNQMQLSKHTHKSFKGREGGWITKRNFYSQVSFIALVPCKLEGFTASLTINRTNGEA